MNVGEILEKLTHCRKTARGWLAQCPAHEDKNASLEVWEPKDGGIGLKCYAGCTHEAICAALGIEQRDCFPHEEKNRPRTKTRNDARRIVATYDYFTKDRKPIIRVVRYDPKGFARMSPDGKGGWQWGHSSNAVALYRWPELAAAVEQGKAVFVCEGEKDVDNMNRAGAIATTCLGGASKWRGELAAEFKGAAEVRIIADRDSEANGYAGQKFAAQVKAAIAAQGVIVRAACLPVEINGHPVKDASDALAAGWNLQNIEEWFKAAPDIESEFSLIPSASADIETMRAAINSSIGAAMMDGGGRNGGLSADTRREIIIESALAWMRKHGSFYFDLEAADAGAALYFLADTKELFKMASTNFSSWLARESGYNRIKNEYRALEAACIDAALRADFSTKVKLSRYWECRDGKAIYLSNGEGDMARITADGVTTVTNGADGVLFQKGRTCAPWTLLDKNEGIYPLEMRVLGDISTPDNNLAPLLLLLWILSLPRNLDNKPPLSLCGEVGSGKTRTARGIFEIFGIEDSICAADKSDKGAEEFWVFVSQGGLTVLDNVDSRFSWLPDAVAGASTGGRKKKRKLYSDDELVSLVSRCAVIITSANPLYATDAGLADRLINIVFERPESRAASDAELSAEIAASRDGLMSWIAWTLSDALRVTEIPPENLNKRHPDWAAWCWRCGFALGLQAETEKALRRAESDKALVAVKSDALIGSVLYRIMGELGEAWEGTAKELRELMTKGGGVGCGHYADSLYSIPEFTVKPEDYDLRSKDALTGYKIGKYCGLQRVQLKEVFNMSSRLLHGECLWRFEPPRVTD